MTNATQKPYLDTMGITSWKERKSPSCPESSVVTNRGTDWLVVLTSTDATEANLSLLDKILAAAKAKPSSQMIQAPEAGPQRDLEEWVRFAKAKMVLVLGEPLAQSLLGTGIDLQAFRQKSWPAMRVTAPIVVTHPLSALGEQASKREAWHDVQYAQRLLS